MKKIIISFFIIVLVALGFLLYPKKELIKEDKLSFDTKIDPIVMLKEKFTKIEGITDIVINAKQAIIIDALTGRVLLEKNADERMTPSSMSKMMTSYLIESKILGGEISRDHEFLVSEKAWRMQGSKMFVPLGQRVKVLDLLKGVIIQSGNDACVVLAEGSSGSEAMFVKEMNEVAQKMGMLNTHFKNSSGWPEEGHYSTARDLAILGLRVVNDHQEFYKLYSEKTFSYNSIEQGNRNPLLYDNLNCDGIKTGHTDDGGYGMVASFLDGDQRYIMVINGLSTMNDRAHEARSLLAWVKENFIYKPIIKKNQLLEEKILVKNGKKDTLSVAPLNDIKMLTPRGQQKNTMKILSQSIDAPIKEGQIIGKMSLETALGVIDFPIVATESIERLGYFKLVAKQVFSYVFREK